jgi:hypothetical protein
MKKKLQLIRIAKMVVIVTGLIFVSSCEKEEINKYGDAVWTEVNQDGFDYLGISPEKELMAVKLNSNRSLPQKVFYKKGNDPAITVWFDNDGLPQMLHIDGDFLLFQNIRPNYMDIGAISNGEIEILRDFEYDHGFLDLSERLKSALGDGLSNTGLIVDGLFCAAGVAATVLTKGIAVKLAKISCMGLLKQATAKGVKKIVNNDEFSDAMDAYSTLQLIASTPTTTPSVGSVMSSLGSAISFAENNWLKNDEVINLTAGVLQGGTGDIQVTLTWDSICDLDLWVTDPYGEKIKWSNKTSASGGYLDYDNRYGYGPENIFWHDGQAPAGTYEVRVDYFAGSGTSTYSVMVILNDVVLNNGQPFTGQISPYQTIHITNFSVGVKGVSVAINNVEESSKPKDLK